LIEVQQRAADGNVGQGDAFANQVGSGKQMRVQRIQAALDIFLCALGRLLIESHDADGWVHPCARGWQDFGVGE